MYLTVGGTNEGVPPSRPAFSQAVIDRIATPGLFRPGNTTFYFRHTNTQGNADSSIFFGQPGWLPVSGVFGLD